MVDILPILTKLPSSSQSQIHRVGKNPPSKTILYVLLMFDTARTNSHNELLLRVPLGLTLHVSDHRFQFAALNDFETSGDTTHIPLILSSHVAVAPANRSTQNDQTLVNHIEVLGAVLKETVEKSGLILDLWFRHSEGNDVPNVIVVQSFADSVGPLNIHLTAEMVKKVSVGGEFLTNPNQLTKTIISPVVF